MSARARRKHNIKFNNLARGIGFENGFIKSIILADCRVWKSTIEVNHIILKYDAVLHYLITTKRDGTL